MSDDDATCQALLVQEFELAQAVARVGSWSLDSGTGKVTWSKEMRRLMGADPEDMGAPDRFSELVHPEDRPTVEATFARTLTDLEDSTNEFRIVRADGQTRWIRNIARWLRDETGAPVRLVGTSQDITEARAAAEAQVSLKAKVERAQRLDSLGVMAGGIAHDFNNLLVAILGNASLALEGLPPGSPMCELLEEVESAARAAADLAGQMLAYAGHSRLATAPLDLSRMLRDLDKLMSAAVSRRATLTVEPRPGPLPVVGDAKQLGQVLLNLVTNASESFGDTPGRIWVRAGARRLGADDLEGLVLTDGITPGDYTTIEVEDDGPGIAGQDIERLFDPFFTTKFTGRGLGLAVVLGVVRSHGGSIRVESPPGGRTRFTLFLPASRRLEELPLEPSVSTRWSGEGAVLVVDDEPGVLAVSRRMLERIGFEVLTSEDSALGLELFRRNQDRMRIAILDLTMPGMDGVELLEQIRGQAPGVVVLLSSGFSPSDAERRLGGTRPDGFLQKPYTLPSMRDALRDALETRRQASS